MRMFPPEKNHTLVVGLAKTVFGLWAMWAAFVVSVAVRLQSYLSLRSCFASSI